MSGIITGNLDRNLRAALAGLPIDPRDMAPDIAGIQARAFAEGQKAATVVRGRQNANAFASSFLSAGPVMAKMASGGIVYSASVLQPDPHAHQLADPRQAQGTVPVGEVLLRERAEGRHGRRVLLLPADSPGPD